MSLLESASRPDTNRPLILTIYGPAGCGKTSLACTFEDAFLIRTQGEQLPRDVSEGQMPMALPPLGSKLIDVSGKKVWDKSELFDQLTSLVKDEHNFKTVIFDSVTGLEDMFIQSVVDADPKKPKSIVQAAGGYGAGRAAVRALHSRVRKAAEILRERRGMNVIFLAHVEIDRLDPPDGDPYSSYSLQLHKESAPIYVNSSDIVAFMKQDTIVMGEEGESKKAITTGQRYLSVDMTPASVSKNRLGIEKDIPVKKGENPFAEYM